MNIQVNGIRYLGVHFLHHFAHCQLCFQIFIYYRIRTHLIIFLFEFIQFIKQSLFLLLKHIVFFAILIDLFPKPRIFCHFLLFPYIQSVLFRTFQLICKFFYNFFRFSHHCAVITTSVNSLCPYTYQIPLRARFYPITLYVHNNRQYHRPALCFLPDKIIQGISDHGFDLPPVTDTPVQTIQDTFFNDASGLFQQLI